MVAWVRFHAAWVSRTRVQTLMGGEGVDVLDGGDTLGQGVGWAGLVFHAELVQAVAERSITCRLLHLVTGLLLAELLWKLRRWR